MESKIAPIATKVSVIGSLRLINPGESAEYSAAEFSCMSSVCSAASRLNAMSGKAEYKVTTDNNGVTFTVTREK